MWNAGGVVYGRGRVLQTLVKGVLVGWGGRGAMAADDVAAPGVGAVGIGRTCDNGRDFRTLQWWTGSSSFPVGRTEEEGHLYIALGRAGWGPWYGRRSVVVGQDGR